MSSEINVKISLGVKTIEIFVLDEPGSRENQIVDKTRAVSIGNYS
jgi:hypothetical protein